MTLYKYIKAARPVNILLVIATQWLIYRVIILPPFLELEIEPRLDVLHFTLFTFVTACITIGGYYINDAVDRVTDVVNKKDRSLSKDQALKGYGTMVGLGGFIAFYLAYYIGEMHLFIIYPSAVILLYYYSKWWKGQGVLGNLIVGLFTSGVTLILLVAEPDLCYAEASDIQDATHIIIAYSVFAFVLNILREIIKDLQDMEGDQAQGYHTLPLQIGVPKTKFLLIFLVVIFLFILAIWLYYQQIFVGIRAYSLFIIFIGAPLAISILRINKADHPIHYKSISTLYKWVMLAGLISIFIIK